MPHKGRTLMGYEKLLLQGIPFSRLLLGPETEVQLSDLAGNAMSVSVVCATMLAAICAPQLRRERSRSPGVSLESFRVTQKHDAVDGGVLAERGDLYDCMDVEMDQRDFSDVFRHVTKGMAEKSYRSSVLCTCESSGATAKEPKILECTDCGVCICHDCSSRHRIGSHALKEINVCTESGRPDPHVFERELRCAVPPLLRLGKGWEHSVEDAMGMESYGFQLQQVDRKRGHWELIYGAWEDFGSSRQVAEIRVVIGRTGTLDRDLGVAAYLRCFAPAIRHSNPQRGPLFPHARLILKLSKLQEPPRWEIPSQQKKSVLKIVGSSPGPSQRVQVGLTDEAAKSFRNYKVTKQYIPRVQSRNNLIQYHGNWKTWPSTLDISGDITGLVNGKYQRLSCEQTVVHSALWRRAGSGGRPTLYLLFRPDVLRSGLDTAVICATPSYRDGHEVCELHDWIPENALETTAHQTKAKFKEWEKAPSHLKVEVLSPTVLMNMKEESFHDQVCSGTIETSRATLCELNGLSRGVVDSLLEHNESSGNEAVTELDLVGRSRARNGKRLSIVAAPSLLKYAAEGKLPLEFSKWYRLPTFWSFGDCQLHVPTRPVEKWRAAYGRKVKFERFYDPEESNEYYQVSFSTRSSENALGMSVLTASFAETSSSSSCLSS